MKPYVKKVVDKHPYCTASKRAKEFKTPKSSSDRESATAARMESKKQINNEIKQT
jgi:ribosomal protein S21